MQAPGEAMESELGAPLGQLFQWDISAQPIGPITVGNGSNLTLESAPSWQRPHASSSSGSRIAFHDRERSFCAWKSEEVGSAIPAG